MTDTCIPHEAVDSVVVPLFQGNVDGSFEALVVAFDEYVGGPDEEKFTALAKALADEVEVGPGTVVFGPGALVWGNPDRDDWAWRCGCCRWTGSNYGTEYTGRSSAERHLVEHPGAWIARPGLKRHTDAA